MKKFIVLALIVLPFVVSAQQPFKDFCKKYKSQENVVDIRLQGWMVKLASRFTDMEKEEKKLLRKVSGLRVLVVEDKNIVSQTDYKQLIRNVRNDDFEDLVQVKNGKEKVHIFMKERQGKIRNIFIIVNSEEEFVVLSLKGRFSWKDIKSMHLDVKGGEHLKKLPNEQPRA